MTQVAQWVRDMCESVTGPHLEVGMTTKHPDGRTVKIIDGQYWGERGMSNFFYWREVKRDGSLGKKEHGYGWTPINDNS